MGKFLIFVAMLAVLLSSAIACNRADQAAHSLHINGSVHVYASEVPPASYPGTNFIAELGPADHPQVLQTKSGNGYRAAKVRLDDGREGWVFSGEPVEIQ